MEYSNNNDVLIILNIIDRRGRRVRISEIRDIKLRVWTTKPECALTFGYRDIVQKCDCDVLVIHGKEMEALASGVITYSYMYKQFDDKHDFCYHHGEQKEVVITDIYWKNRFLDGIIESPTYYRTLEYLKDLINKERKDRIEQVKDIQVYVDGECNDKIDEEIERSTKRDDEFDVALTDLEDLVESNYQEYTDEIADLREQLKFVLGVDINKYATKEELTSEITRLLGEAPEAYDTLEKIAGKLSEDDDIFQAIKEILTDKISKDEVYNKSEIDKKIDDVNYSIQSENQRATLIEGGLKTQIDNLTDEQKNLSEKVNSHITKSDEDILEIKRELAEEITRATNTDNVISNSVDLFTGNLNTLTDKVNNHIEESETYFNKIKSIESSVEVINGDENLIGSIKHSLQDAKHYTDDEILRLKAILDVVDFDMLKKIQDEFEWEVVNE